MTKDTFTLLAAYNRAANEKMGALLGTLSGEEWTRDFGGFFPSAGSLCAHLYVCDYIWLGRFYSLPGVSQDGREFFTQKKYAFREAYCFPRDEFLGMRSDLDQRLAGFIEALDEGLLAKNFSYTNSRGDVTEKSFAGLLLHLFNHQTHHRGMVSVYLDMLGKDNDFNMIQPVL
ncbi:MAG: DinB family protein [Treponema sp.]|jgi:uncharacterized damage-inducible protein DinB|nr:DinB family protein [Treponema sp.]